MSYPTNVQSGGSSAKTGHSYLNDARSKELQEFLFRDAASLRSLNFGETFIKETLDNTKKWGECGLLQGISDPYIMRQCARLMENQRLVNENVPFESADPAIKRISIPVVRRVFGAFCPFEWVSIQAMPAGKSSFYITGLDERTQGFEIDSKTRALQTRWDFCPTIEGRCNSLDAEADACADFSQGLCLEFTREIVRDLRQNTGSQFKAVFETPAKLLGSITGAASYVGMKLNGREANWILVGPAVTKQLKTLEQFQAVEYEYGRPDIAQVGVLDKKIKVFEDVKQTNDVLLGFFDPRMPYFSGYFYCPFLFVDPLKKEGNTRLAQYGKKLVAEGEKFYGLLELSGLPESEPDNSVNQEVA